MSGSNFGDSMGWSSSGRSSGSRRGKRGGGSGGADKPKQPQRGLGVAQLEKIRLQSEMAEYFNPLGQPPSLIHRTGSLNLVSDGHLYKPRASLLCSLWLGVLISCAFGMDRSSRRMHGRRRPRCRRRHPPPSMLPPSHCSSPPSIQTLRYMGTFSLERKLLFFR